APRRQPAAPEPQPPPRAAPAPGVDRGADGVTVAYWGKRGFDPVVGWLVCIEGPEQGRDYRIRRGNNRIGRDETMDIVIRGDDAISRIKQAIITFDKRGNRFLIKEGEGRGLLYLNDEQVVTAAVLEPWDILEMGKSKFCFVPLCCERFQWNVDK
ncbi:MAG: FHA domain-containing protein, partial [bacterium]|nr:FHA domain-containing protein [bacterium]